MGRCTIEDTLDQATEDEALAWHLTANHYPPIHRCFLPIARQTVAAEERPGPGVRTVNSQYPPGSAPGHVEITGLAKPLGGTSEA
jgi:hypothetical protein